MGRGGEIRVVFPDEAGVERLGQHLAKPFSDEEIRPGIYSKNKKKEVEMDQKRNFGTVIMGIFLILIGAFFLFGRFFPFLNMDNLWPMIIVGVGAAFFAAMIMGGKTRGELAVPGSILTVIGLILLVMNVTDTWEAWAYCWALIIFAAGAGVWINGSWNDQPELRRKGMETMRTGLVLFFIFGVIMEFIFSLTEVHRQGSLLLWAVLLTLAGLLLLAVRLLRPLKADGEKGDLFWPVMMTGAGLLACLSYFGLLPAENLQRLWNLWPLLLIAAGVGILFRDRSRWIGLILGLAILAALLVVGLAGGQLGLPRGSSWNLGFGWTSCDGGSAEAVTGSGVRTEETRTISGVDRVELAIGADVEIRQGPEESLTITADDNLLPLLRTDVSGGRLTIDCKPGVNIQTVTPVKVTLVLTDLAELRLSSSGSVRVGPLTTADLGLLLSSSGDLTIDDVRADTITANLSSSGDLTVQGEADALEVNLSSSGSFQGEMLKVQTADASLTSSGDATLWVVSELQANLSSSGSLWYFGKPEIRQTTSSSGRLTAKGEK
jgi:hypothetical protein